MVTNVNGVMENVVKDHGSRQSPHPRPIVNLQALDTRQHPPGPISKQPLIHPDMISFICFQKKSGSPMSYESKCQEATRATNLKALTLLPNPKQAISSISQIATPPASIKSL